jgi:ribonucleoside-diphosphate reductase alpha chain
MVVSTFQQEASRRFKKMQGPQLAFSDELDATKYRGERETHRDACYRVASALKDDDAHYRVFSDILLDQRFLTAGRVRSAMGSLREVTPYNCYVSGTIEDSMVEGHGSIMARLVEAAATMRMGGGIGYDFSPLRPYRDLIKSQQTYASGPVSFMQAYDATCKTIASAGHRRGAQMAVLRVDHPDIETYIHAKHPTAETQVLWEMVESITDPVLRARAAKALQETLPLTAFNMSIAITDEFMECLETGKPFPLKFGGQVYREVDPQALWEMIMRSTWDWAEPGVLFIDTINRMNNLWYCETIAATNPCGEQPLPPHGACLLGSFNLVKYLIKDGLTWHFDWDQFAADIPPVVRAMDNIVDRAKYPLYEQEKEARSKRRMGLGVTGLANCIEAMGFPYGSPGFLQFEQDILYRLNHEAYMASIQLSKEKGPFKLFDAQQYLSGQYIKGLDAEVQEGIAKHGIRNSHLTSLAPTGTISMTADNVSSGIEPVFEYSFTRDIRTADGPRVEKVEDYGVRLLGMHGKRSADVTIQEHLAVLAVASQNVDSAVSKTCNVPGDTSWDEFKATYVQAWDAGCKGCTTFRTDGKRTGIFTVSEDDAQEEGVGDETGVACYVDQVTGRHECE